jgi:hypothetical protein
MIPIQNPVDLVVLILLIAITLVLIPYMYKQYNKTKNLAEKVQKIEEETGSKGNTKKENSSEEVVGTSDLKGSTPPVGSFSEEAESGEADEDEDDDGPSVTDVSDSDVF